MLGFGWLAAAFPLGVECLWCQKLAAEFAWAVRGGTHAFGGGACLPAPPFLALSLLSVLASHAEQGGPEGCGAGPLFTALLATQLTDNLQTTRLVPQNKEDLKTVALGTSKINYLDPRITVAW